MDIQPIQPPRTGDVLHWFEPKATVASDALVIVKGSDYYTWDGKTLKQWEVEDLLLFILKSRVQIHRWKEEK